VNSLQLGHAISRKNVASKYIFWQYTAHGEYLREFPRKIALIECRSVAGQTLYIGKRESFRGIFVLLQPKFQGTFAPLIELLHTGAIGPGNKKS